MELRWLSQTFSPTCGPIVPISCQIIRGQEGLVPVASSCCVYTGQITENYPCSWCLQVSDDHLETRADAARVHLQSRHAFSKSRPPVLGLAHPGRGWL